MYVYTYRFICMHIYMYIYTNMHIHVQQYTMFFLSRTGPTRVFPHTHVYVVFMYCNAFEVLIRGSFVTPLIVTQADIKCDRNNYRN